jgi:hypothetical protein
MDDSKQLIMDDSKQLIVILIVLRLAWPGILRHSVQGSILMDDSGKLMLMLIFYRPDLCTRILQHSV